MATTPSADNTFSGRRGTLILLALIAAGLAGNYFRFPIFLDIDFTFGSIFALLALQLFGVGRGTLAAAVIASGTYLLWNHPYSIIVMTAEVAVVGALMGRRGFGMIQADALYWLFIGMPLTYLFFHLAMHVPTADTYLVMTKQAVNCIANALTARLIFTGYALWSRNSLTTYREIIYNLLAFFVLIPTLILLTFDSGGQFSRTDLRIRTRLRQDSESANHRLQTWLLDRKSALVHLAQLSASRSAQQMQPCLEQAKKSDLNFNRIGLMDREATATAFYPLLDELGQRNVGRNFADRPHFLRLQQTLKPVLSEVMRSRIGKPQPMVAMLAPVLIRGTFGGYIAGIMSMRQLEDFLNQISGQKTTLYSLLDKNGTVIMSNRSDQKLMTPFVRGKGRIESPGDGVSQWVPDAPANSPKSERWRRSVYVSESSVGDPADWKLVLEQPVAPFQKALYDDCSVRFTLLLLLLLGALALAELLSRRIAIKLGQLSLLTDQLPGKLASGDHEIAWPESGIEEAHKLIYNFRGITDLLILQFSQIRQINDNLEQQVELRTKELRESKNFTLDVIDSLPSSIAVIDTSGLIVAVNANWRISARENNDPSITLDYVGTNYLEVCRKSMGRDGGILAESAFMGITAVMHGEKNHFSMEHPWQLLGQERWCLMEASALKGSRQGAVLSLRDISRRKETEEDLKEANKFIEQVIDCAQEGVVVYDLDLRYRVWNPFMEKITGLTAGEVLGRHPTELFPYLTNSGLPERLERVLAGDTPSAIDFPYIDARTAEPGWVSNLSSPIMDSKGIVIGIIATVREITWRKRVEEELRQALESAEAANSTMTRLLRTVAHEFRTPLGLLTGCTDILDRYWDRLTPGKRYEQNEYIRNAARQLTNLVNSITSFNLADPDQNESPVRLLDVGKICRAIAADVATAWGTDHEFEVTIAADCGTALLDESLFRRVLENLLTNAFRYTPLQGSVSLKVSREENRLQMEITDSGIGIPEEDQKLIFGAFYRCQNVGQRRGLGLGLSIVQESLSQMGATITVTSRINAGSTMAVEIPLVDPG